MARFAASKIAVSALTALLAAAVLAIAAAGANAARASAAPPAGSAAATAAHHHARGAKRRHRARRHRGGPSFSGGLTVGSGRAVTAPQVPAGPCPNANLEPSAGNLAPIKQATLCLINKERVGRGLVALADNAKLDAAAAHHNNDMIAKNYFEHVAPGGETPEQRIRAAGYIPASAGFEIGENIATGSTGLDTPAQIVAAWMDSAGHRANILDPHYLETGLAVTDAIPAQVGDGRVGATYTQDFGVIT
jgi:uncharacterized protein YkwD